ncbi:MAG: 1-phosphofructokinase family hexose kinase [Deltaproteobacteria bacterium]|nr:1-phosphofructokinase family hexose kinase [Deltaproteobacteria bacterium]
MKSIVTLTMNPCIDINATVDRVVAERKLRCDSSRYEPGGGGVNVSRAVKKLGGESLALLPAGGAHGQLLQDLLDREGVNREVVSIQGWTRESFIAFESETGQQYRFSLPGPRLLDEEWNQCLDRFHGLCKAAGLIVASGGLPPGVPEDFYALLARSCREKRFRLVLDTSGAPLRKALDTYPFLIKPNLRELSDMAGKELESDTEIQAFSRKLVEEEKSEVVVVSLGAAGALLTWKDGQLTLRAPTVPIKSKVGAGDSMVAGLVLALDRGMTLEDAARFGVAGGAAAVMTPGTELCRREDAERLFASMSAERSGG